MEKIEISRRIEWLKEELNKETRKLNRLKKDDRYFISSNVLRGIINIICNYYSVPIESALGKSRKSEYVIVRQLITYFAKKYIRYIPSSRIIGYMSDNELAYTIGYSSISSHGMINNNITSVENLINTDNIFKRSVDLLHEKIESFIKTKKVNMDTPSYNFKFPTIFRVSKERISSYSIEVELDKKAVIKTKYKLSYPDGISKEYDKYFNITSPEKLHSIAKTLWNKKKRQGYKEVKVQVGQDKISCILNQVSEVRTDENKSIIPMKAQPFKSNKIGYPAIIQPKFNGLRGIVSNVVEAGLFTEKKIKFKSNNNKLFNLPELEVAVSNIINSISSDSLKGINIDNIAFDGELYLHKTLLQEIRSNIYNNKRVDYYIFDLAVLDIPQQDRFSLLSTIFNRRKSGISKRQINSFQDISKVIYKGKNNNIRLVNNFIVESEEEARNMAEQFIALGFEGGILRSLDGMYKSGKRSHDLMKFKKSKIAKVKILDVIPTKHDTYLGHPIAVFVCENDLNTEVFSVTPAGEKITRKNILDRKDKYIGKEIYIKFYERTAKKVPFHANEIK